METEINIQSANYLPVTGAICNPAVAVLSCPAVTQTAPPGFSKAPLTLT